MHSSSDLTSGTGALQMDGQQSEGAAAMAGEVMCVFAVLEDRTTGERWAHAVLWTTTEGDRLRQMFGKFSRWDCTTYLAYESAALAMLKGEQPLPAPVDMGQLGPNATQPSARSKGAVWIIRRGDTIAQIAAYFRVSVEDILAVNPQIDVNNPQTWDKLGYIWLPENAH